MRSRGVYLGRFAGVEVFAQLSTLVIAGLLTWSFASGLLPASVPDRLPVVYWSVAIVGALAFLASLLGHELSHSVVAKHNGVEVEGITLWLFGGVASLKGHAPGPGAEFRIAVAGPAASFVIAAVATAGSALVYALDGPRVWVVMLGYLALLNGFLAVFNLLPGAPLDGGRILGSILWKLRGDRATGMAGAAKAGTVVAGLIVAAGFAEMWFTGSYGGLWTILIGVFLFNAARAEAGYYDAERALSGVSAASVMSHPVQVAGTWSTVASAVHGPFATSAQTALPVVDATQQIRGMLTMDQVRATPVEYWETTEVGNLMTDLTSTPMVSPADPVTAVMERLGTQRYALVLDQGVLVGMIGPEEIRRWVERTRNPAAGGARHGGTSLSR